MRNEDLAFVIGLVLMGSGGMITLSIIMIFLITEFGLLAVAAGMFLAGFVLIAFVAEIS